MKKYLMVLGPLLASSAVACGGAAVPEAEMVKAKTSVSAAQAVGAEQEPKAALHLKLARDEIAAAEAFIADGDNDKARAALDRARLDAELALALTREAGTEREAQEAIDKVEALKNRKGSST